MSKELPSLEECIRQAILAITKTHLLTSIGGDDDVFTFVTGPDDESICIAVSTDPNRIKFLRQMMDGPIHEIELNPEQSKKLHDHLMKNGGGVPDDLDLPPSRN